MIAARHIDALPRAVRTMLDAVGVSSRQSDVKGSALASQGCVIQCVKSLISRRY